MAQHTGLSRMDVPCTTRVNGLAVTAVGVASFSGPCENATSVLASSLVRVTFYRHVEQYLYCMFNKKRRQTLTSYGEYKLRGYWSIYQFLGA
jgi:hypothetical protein